MEAIKERVDKLESEVSDMRTRLAVAERDIETVKSILDKISNNTTWILRLVLGAIVMAVLGLVFTGGGPVQ